MNRTQLSQLAVLSAVAAHGSFRGAAKELGIAPSAVSHAVGSLEASLGVRLLARTTRSVAATEEGKRLLERLRPALDDIAEALQRAAEARDRPAGKLRITAPRFAADLILAPRLGDFLGRYPDIVLEIANEDGFTNIVEEGYDAGIRLGESLEADMVAVKVGPELKSAVVAAPSYFERFQRPWHPRDLAGHRCIRRRFSNGTIYRWEFEKEGEELTVSVNGPLILGEDRPIIEAAIGGAGLLAYLFEPRVSGYVAEGRLVRVLEDWCAPYAGPFLYYPTRRLMRPALRVFIDFFRHSG
ncbi:LysR family transcriptional regulator [Sinorhizobium meliloti WSM1022]|jgi:DNA-binding transcriptional LysR family regulator|uniref:LysR family transcriptional regulator n=2 Tax=Rhizobium meliloti TaxID=382 RepID=UPI00041D44E5|nr:LysR family transcriptional regulator [Sinorhizobium meliloti]ASQ05337.1 LysR family transcriptional regulator [Sinorhizobium meliloti]MCO6424287.1 LysR family transcriptional regulator [Sinorhizobium meliloti]MDW9410813.1 LysR family transcriptional regulator [Sinorhizobium meliloti]MDW9442969.1 LysR family transcriptional regulator [Sinorhizobium meliloti]MDW9456902.1 LysR family transcriptional regulator [Sinorhizobium meliloti]